MSTLFTSLLNEMEAALRLEAERAASIYVKPKDSRAYDCSSDGCDRPAYAKGYCNAHYLRHRSGADMTQPLRARKRDDVCVECGEQTGAKGGWGLCVKHYKRKRFNVLKDAAVKVMGGKCAHCGGTFHRAVYDFHHRGEKTDAPHDLIGGKGPKTIALELSACILLCANCHRSGHHDDTL